MFAMTKILATSLLLAAALAPDASADGLSIHFGKKTKHGSFGIQYSTDFAAYRPACYAPARRVWVPGHFETVCREVWIAGFTERVWCPPVYEWRYTPCGQAYRVCVSPGNWKSIGHPGHTETRREQVWRDGGWQ